MRASWSCVQAVAAHQGARADDVAAGLPLGRALVLVVPVGLDLEARVLCALPGADLGVFAPDHAHRLQVAGAVQALGGGVEAAVVQFVSVAFGLHEGVEVVGADQLVLGAVDEPHQAAQGPVRVVAQVKGGRDLAQEEQLADAVEDVRACREPGVGGVLGEDALAEAVEVADRHARAGGRTHDRVQALAELRRGLDVVGEDEDLLRREGAVEGIAVPRGRFRGDGVAGRRGVALGGQQPADALHDDARLPRPGARDDHDGTVVRLDDRALLGGELLGELLGRQAGLRAGQRFGHRTSPPRHAAACSLEGRCSEQAPRCTPNSFGHRSVAPLEAGSVPGTGLRVIIRARSSRPAVTGCMAIRA